MENKMPIIHLLLTDELNNWDPFGVGGGNYETEIADVIQVLHLTDNQNELAIRIQEIYEFSFEKIIPMDNCYEISGKLLEINSSGTCAL